MTDPVRCLTPFSLACAVVSHVLMFPTPKAEPVADAEPAGHRRSLLLTASHTTESLSRCESSFSWMTAALHEPDGRLISRGTSMRIRQCRCAADWCLLTQAPAAFKCRWLQRSRNSPVTNQPLASLMLTPNLALSQVSCSHTATSRTRVLSCGPVLGTEKCSCASTLSGMHCAAS